MPELTDYIDDATLTRLIETAKLEDLGPDGVDVTSACFIQAAARCSASFVSRQRGYVAGLAVLPKVCEVFGGAVELQPRASDGDWVDKGQVLAQIAGPTRDVLTIERTALNLLCHLSGIASLTADYVAKCERSAAGVYDTRKTLPGLRGLQKYAVACGGGGTHRIGLYDAVLIKDNHLAGVPLDQLADHLTKACEQARAAYPGLKFIEVEVDTLVQLEQVLKAPVDIVLLDNMPTKVLAEAVAMRNAAAPGVELEASGGVTLHTVSQIAGTGVNRISVGALTHSAPSLDIGLDIG